MEQRKSYEELLTENKRLKEELEEFQRSSVVEDIKEIKEAVKEKPKTRADIEAIEDYQERQKAIQEHPHLFN